MKDMFMMTPQADGHGAYSKVYAGSMLNMLCPENPKPRSDVLQDLCLFLETPGPRGARRLQQPKSEVLLFLKAFDPSSGHALQVCCIEAARTS